ncbi:MAG: pyridoxal phosphate-dependent aminotransferase [Paracoccaceae bacterium]
MQLSDRVCAITAGGSDGWEVFLRARQMIATGVDVLELTIGEHDIGTEPAILGAMDASARGGNTGYAVVPGQRSLREAVAKRFQARTGFPTTWENVIITPGAQAGLFAAHTAALDPGDAALYCDPYYTTYPGVIRGAGAQARAVKTHSEHGFQPQRGDLEAAPKGAKSLLINSPNNPTGVVYSRQTMETIASFAIQNDLWLITDEVYDTQVWEGEHISPRTLPGMAARTLVVGSMSKSHAMTGSRIGWIIAEKEVISRLTDLAVVTNYGVPGFIQDAALFALGQGAPLENRVADTFRRRRVLALETLKGKNAVRLVPASGAMYLMLDIRATGLSGIEFANRLLESEKIAVMPGESFGKAAAGHLRVAMTVNDACFVRALRAISDFAADLTA